MATASKTQKGFNVRCPQCGAEDSLKISVEDVSELTCGECDEKTGPDDIRAMMATWGKLLSWLDSAPEYEA